MENNIVCSVLAPGKIILKESQENLSIRWSKFHLRKFTNKLPLNGEKRCSKFHLRKIYKKLPSISEDVNDICSVICPKQNLAKLNLISSQMDDTSWVLKAVKKVQCTNA